MKTVRRRKGVGAKMESNCNGRRSVDGDDKAEEIVDNSEDSQSDFEPPQRKRARTPPNQISPLLINHVSLKKEIGAK